MQIQRRPVHLEISPVQLDAQLPDGNRHKARLADIAHRAKLAEEAYSRLAEVAIGLNREGSEG
jgi:hypothetical protein